MFSTSRSRYQSDSFSKKVSKPSSKSSKRSFRDTSTSRRAEAIEKASPVKTPQTSPTLTSAIVTISVGRDQRLFAAHEDVLSNSPYLQTLCHEQFFTSTKRINLPEDEPEIFSCVLEYLYKGDYYPRLCHDKRRNTWALESNAEGGPAEEATVYHPSVGGMVLKDTVIYCTAERFGLEELKRLALRKQGLQSGIQCSTILTSARFAYANTPDNDSRLRAHYLTLIIRTRHTFKRSGTMQNEMEAGGKLFFDLFVAMSNHMDDVSTNTPKSLR